MNPERIVGPWKEGYTLDLHTTSSILIGYDEYGHAQFATTRSELGERLYRLKYQRNQAEVAPLADAAANFVTKWGIAVDVVVPVPATRVRAVQPVVAVARQVATKLARPFDDQTIKRTRKAQELKGVIDADERAKLLDGAFRIDGNGLQGKSVLLVDDLFRSGATMKAVAQLLQQAGGASEVFALALTRTRTAT